jgi:hypothetical protein
MRKEKGTGPVAVAGVQGRGERRDADDRCKRAMPAPATARPPGEGIDSGVTDGLVASGCLAAAAAAAAGAGAAEVVEVLVVRAAGGRRASMMPTLCS